jgi:peroxiredoxin
MTLNIGDKAPQFSLWNTEKAKVSLADYSDKNVLVLFFPLAFAGACTTELCDVRDNLKKYETTGVDVIAISVDSFLVLGKFKAEHELNFPLLSDFNKEISRIYGCLYENFVLDMKGVSKRSAFLVDKKGIIRYAEVLENASELPNFVAIQEAIANL